MPTYHCGAPFNVFQTRHSHGDGYQVPCPACGHCPCCGRGALVRPHVPERVTFGDPPGPSTTYPITIVQPTIEAR